MNDSQSSLASWLQKFLIFLSDLSDHNLIFISEEISINIKTKSIKKPDMPDKNIKNFCNQLANDDWDSFMNENDTIKAFDFFYSKISTTAEEHFPLKHVKLKIDKRVPWMTPGLLISKNKKINFI